ncbi:LysR family transcriptional regulator [Novosphingobium panipatense]|uniref:LysR family transcriptional regulator n=1 Tax=Novosphingobium panipatense TaxID=428991 RepID=UPI0036144DFA
MRSPHVTMPRMRAMLAVAETGSYTGASQATGLSVPSIHRAVTDLSLAMRRALVTRRGKFAMTTEAGNQLARELRLAQVELEAALSEVQALRGHETRRIAIGAMPLSRARILPAAVARFLARRPQVRLTIVEGSRTELVEPLRSGVLDVMVGALRDPLTEPDLVQHRLFDDVPGFYARRGHPLSGTAPDAADLARFPFTLAPRGTPCATGSKGTSAIRASPACGADRVRIGDDDTAGSDGDRFHHAPLSRSGFGRTGGGMARAACPPA